MKKIKSLLCALSSLTIAMTSAMAAVPAYAAEVLPTAAVEEETTVAPSTENVHYVYAGLTWEEYWASEGVYAADDTSSSDEEDDHGETDKGGFDAVSRATINHGLHRGSFQCIAYIVTEDGTQIGVNSWTDKINFISTTGETVEFQDGVLKFADGSTKKMADYKVVGTKYVPVAVADADYEDFCSKYTVVENGGQLVGGYSEKKLSAYDCTSEVTADTNGLKTATKNADGTYSFSARKAGTASGIANAALKTVDQKATPATVQDGTGQFGEFLRVDITGDYADLGASMQAVKWTYYGSDSTYSKPLQSYGTKFAADNWMHSNNGIQLGLTDSVRCKLPEETNGTGYWSVTVYALGYEDTTFNVKAEENNIFNGYVYGTMNIPYSEFFANEGKFENGVDAVSSATTSKYKMNEKGKLAEGTYYTDNANGAAGGKINGVTFPVAVSKVSYESGSIKEKLDEYGFVVNKDQNTVPEAYKVFTYDAGDGDVEFSEVQDKTPETSDVKASLETSTSYGDYQLDFAEAPYNSEEEVFYGAIVTTDDGATYPMTILENWWRPKNELAWSIGYIGSEKSKIHNANVLKYNETKDLTDKKITSVTFITSSGYTTVETNIYLPKKTGLDKDVISVKDAALKDGKTAVTVKLPDDYKASYKASSDKLSVSDGNVVFGKDVLPGKYSITVSDDNGKNVSYSTSFIISTDEAAAAVSKDGKSIAAASGVSADAFSNYISNITAVKIGDKSYNASGRGAVKLINADGTINESVTSKDRDGKETTTDYIKAGDVITISANGYADVTFTYGKSAALLGDVNGDTSIDSKDAVLILQYYAQSLVDPKNITVKADTDAADVNGDASIDSKDAVIVLQYYAQALVDGDKVVSIEEYIANKNK